MGQGYLWMPKNVWPIPGMLGRSDLWVQYNQKALTPCDNHQVIPPRQGRFSYMYGRYGTPCPEPVEGPPLLGLLDHLPPFG